MVSWRLINLKRFSVDQKWVAVDLFWLSVVLKRFSVPKTTFFDLVVASSNMNPADLTTRITQADRLSSLLWMEGPPFLRQPYEKWPVKTDGNINIQDIPDKIVVNMTVGEDITVESIQRLDVVEINKFNTST